MVVNKDLDLDSEDSLSHVDVSNSDVEEVELWLTGGDDVSPSVLLGLCSLSSDLSTNDDLTSLGNSGSLDHVEDGVGNKSHRLSNEELVFDVLGLPGGAESGDWEWNESEVEFVGL